MQSQGTLFITLHTIITIHRILGVILLSARYQSTGGLRRLLWNHLDAIVRSLMLITCSAETHTHTHTRRFLLFYSSFSASSSAFPSLLLFYQLMMMIIRFSANPRDILAAMWEGDLRPNDGFWLSEKVLSSARQVQQQ